MKSRYKQRCLLLQSALRENGVQRMVRDRTSGHVVCQQPLQCGVWAGEHLVGKRQLGHIMQLALALLLLWPLPRRLLDRMLLLERRCDVIALPPLLEGRHNGAGNWLLLLLLHVSCCRRHARH